jgi:diguanylate cyclase (GGDEF)-like protein
MTDPAASASDKGERKGHDRVWLLTAILFAAGFLVFNWWVRPLDAIAAPLHLPWWSLALAFAATDIFVVHLHSRHDAISFSLGEIPLVVGLFFADPTALIIGRIVGGAAALTLHRRQTGTKLAFNLGQFFLFEGVLPVIIFRAVLGAAGPDALMGWTAAFVAILSTNIGSGLAISTAGLLNGSMPLDALGLRALGGGLITALGDTSLALVAVVVLWHDAASSWLLLLLAGVLYVAYRGYISLSQTYSRLETLYSFTRAVNWSLQETPVIETVLSETRELMRAEIAVVTLIPKEPGMAAVRTTLGPEGPIQTTEIFTTTALDEACSAVARSGKGSLIPRPVKDDALREAMHAQGLKDAAIAPLRSENGIVGTIMVANRLSDVGTFETEDLRMLETVTNHASVTLENRRLVDQLREEASEKEHQSLHDNLTGLPNRVLFKLRVEKAISALHGRSDALAVMMLDVDDFKEVNDTLGHHHGDLLLQEIGHRLSEVLRPEDTVARLGGDEFAVLLPSLADPTVVSKVARRISHAFERNYQLNDVTLEVRASIGIALYPEHGTDVETLLKRADVAMYTAKEQKNGVEIYASERDQSNPRRLALMPELRQAIQNDELEVYYQPQARIHDRGVVGVEALLRWQHPEHGFVPPDEFIPMAEHTGLIRPLTLYVLRKSMLQCKEWHRRGFDLRLAVNLSVRSLLDLAFPLDVARLLKETGFDPAYLTLEITETSIMADTGRMLAELKRLDALGVMLSIDDFGTGYSSLSYLSRLPVGEVKIDRSFVMHMRDDDNDAVIVQSVIDLARNLDLQVVAEGIEDAETWRLLATMGCDIAQGYHLGRPMPGARLEHWLAENNAAAMATTPPVALPAQTAHGAEQGFAPGVTPLRPSIRRRSAKGLSL